MKKVYFKPYDYISDDYYYKQLSTTNKSILTFNSKEYVVIKYGSIKHGRFKTRKTSAFRLNLIPKDKQLCLLLKQTPYKIYQYINESEIKDVSDETDVFDIKIIINHK